MEPAPSSSASSASSSAPSSSQPVSQPVSQPGRPAAPSSSAASKAKAPKPRLPPPKSAPSRGPKPVRAPRSCDSCGSTDIEHHESRGSLVCASCGKVLEENSIISEVTFQDTAGGQSSVVGRFVGSTGATSVGGGLAGYGKESRDITIANGRARITELAAQLKLNPHHVDFAVRLFMLAVQHNFVQGRKTQNVCSACLYIVCRREKTPHLLIDFSDVIQTNVFVLGQTFLKLVRQLKITVPLIDPSLYIHRFASKLEFEGKTHAVAMTAVRLVGRMNRDWIQTGRRPAGICGACLLIAARMHNFRRSQKEVIKVVHVCDTTLRNRVDEFADTPTSALTSSEFETIDLDDECEPPAFQRSVMGNAGQARLAQFTNAAIKSAKSASSLKDAEAEARELAPTLDMPGGGSAKSPAKGGKSPAKKLAKAEASALAAADAARTLRRIRSNMLNVETIVSRAKQMEPPELQRVLQQMQVSAEKGQLADKTKQQRVDRIERMGKSHPNLVRWAYARHLARVDAPTPKVWTAPKSSKVPAGLSKAEIAVSTHRPDVGTDGKVAKPGAQLLLTTTGGASSSSSSQKEAALVKLPKFKLGPAEDDNLEDVDDDVDDYLNNTAETKIREKVWTEMNKDYLDDMAEKQRRQAEEAKRGAANPTKKKRKKRSDKGEAGEAPATAAAATMQVLQEKKISNKINYDALNQLFQQPEADATASGGASSAGASSAGESGAAAPGPETAPVRPKRAPKELAAAGAPAPKKAKALKPRVKAKPKAKAKKPAAKKKPDAKKPAAKANTSS